MKPLYRTLLLTEVVVCFFQVFSTLVVRLISVLYIAPAYFARGLPDVEIGALLMIAMLMGGIIGMVAVVSLTIKVLKPSARVISPGKIKAFALCGILSVLGSIWLSVWSVSVAGASWKEYLSVYWGAFIFSLLPIVAVIHLAYLGRKYLFGLPANRDRELLK